jgi:hypothetical protein
MSTLSRNNTCSKLTIDGVTCYGEVQYFTQLAVQHDAEPEEDEDPEEFIHRLLEGPGYQYKTVAIISLYSPPDEELLNLSHHTVWSCTSQGEAGLRIVDVTTICAVVAVIPHRPTLPSGVTQDRLFVVEKTGLDVSHTGIFVEEDNDGEEED